MSPESEQHERLAVARELVWRWLGEELRRGDVMNAPTVVRNYLRLMLAGEEREVFVTLFLNAQHRLIAGEKLFFGTLTQTSVHPREVVKRALAHNAAAVVFAHNHPSGVAEPSHADEMLTRSLKTALSLVDVKTLDHFVVAGADATSFAERGLI
jgi:DNA repair protein RadC